MLCDKKIPIKLKGKVYPMVVRLACCTIQSVRPIKNALVHRRLVVEMRMIRWMCSHTRFNRIKNEVFRKKVGVAPIEDKMRDFRLKWLGHIKRRIINVPVWWCEMIGSLASKRGRGRPRQTKEELQQVYWTWFKGFGTHRGHDPGHESLEIYN